MSSNRLRLRAVIALVGVLAMLASLALAFGSMRDTEATWNDKVVGAAQFGAANPDQGKRFARAMSTYGVMERAVRDSDIGAVTAFRQTPNVSRQIAGPTTSNSVGYWPTNLLPLDTEGFSCSTLDTQSQCDNGNPTKLPNLTANAVSETRSLEVQTSSRRGLDLVTYQEATPIRATAACSPTQGKATLSSGGSIMLGRDTLLENQIAVSVPGPNAEISQPRSWGSYNYDATLQHVQKESPGYALSQLRLRVNATGTGGAERWNLTMILAHAECGVDQETTTAPTRPTTGEWPAIPAGKSSRMALAQVDQPGALQSIIELEEALSDKSTSEEIDGNQGGAPSDETEAFLPSLPADDDRDETSAPGTETTAPTTSSPAAPDTGASTPTAPGQASTTAPISEEPSVPATVPTENATPEPTEQTAVPEGPQQPVSVRVGREFAVVNRDGVELGTAKVEDITRTEGCGVELTLSITTSAEAGPGRWASIGPDDFAEVRPGGSTREASRIGSKCEQAPDSRTAALSPGRGYRIVIAFQLDDSAQQAMLRPAGTAGWTFDLPPLTKVAAISTPSMAPAQAPSQSPTTSAPQVEASGEGTTEA